MKLYEAMHKYGADKLVRMEPRAWAEMGIKSDDCSVLLHLCNYSIVPNKPPAVIKTMQDAYNASGLHRTNVETMVCIYTDAEHRMIAVEEIAVGSETKVAFSVKLIAAGAILVHATHAILLHSHPQGGNVSEQDIVMTDKVSKALATISCKLVEHIVVHNDTLEGIISKDKQPKHETR